MAPPADKPARRQRASYLAPPPLLSESEPFEGAALLRENPGPVGVLLWKSLRDVSLWIFTPPGDRAGLLAAGTPAARRDELAQAAAAPELWAPLLVIGQTLAQPVDVDVRRLAHACRSVARWAEETGAAAAQLAFTQAAALLVPESARLAYAVGRLSRDRGEYARGESWLRAAVRLARNRDWHTYALSYLSLGTLYLQLGNLPAARTLTVRGYRTTVRRRVRALEGSALHNLFVVSAEMLDFPRAHQYALEALKHYGPDHPRFALLAQDVACFWILHGCFDLAARVFLAVLPRCPAPDDQALVLANLARASAAAGQGTVYERSRAKCEELLDGPLVPERRAQVLLNLGRAAGSAGGYDRAEAAIRDCLVLARSLRLGQIQLEGESMLDSLRSARALGSTVPPQSGPPGLQGDAEVLAIAIVLSLGGKVTREAVEAR
jgi:tetratricopeptide (TPR) repeat protein